METEREEGQGQGQGQEGGNGQPSPTGAPPGAPLYETFDGFVSAAIQQYVVKHWSTSPKKVLSLVLASDKPARVLAGSLKQASLPGKLSVAVAGVVLLRFLLRLGVRGPWAWLVMGAGAAGVGALYALNRDKLAEQSSGFRTRIAEAQTAYDEIMRGHQGASYGQEQRDLMIDGLFQRFVKQLDEV